MRFTHYFCAVLCVLTISSCGAGKFGVVRVDDEFSANKNPTYISNNNRISSKSIAGGMHIDAAGVYMNPFIERQAGNNNLLALGLRIINKTSFDSSTGGVNQLGIIKEVAFKADGKLIVLSTTNHKNITGDQINYNSVGKYASVDKTESAVVTMTTEQFKTLANASSIECKVTGTKRDVVYRDKDIAKWFLPNLLSFYNNYVLTL